MAWSFIGWGGVASLRADPEGGCIHIVPVGCAIIPATHIVQWWNLSRTFIMDVVTVHVSTPRRGTDPFASGIFVRHPCYLHCLHIADQSSAERPLFSPWTIRPNYLKVLACLICWPSSCGGHHDRPFTFQGGTSWMILPR